MQVSKYTTDPCNWWLEQSQTAAWWLDLLTMELVQNVSRGTDKLLANFGISATVLCRVMGKHATNWQCDVTSLTLDLWGHHACRSCGPVRLIFGHGGKWAGEWWLWPLTLELVWHVTHGKDNLPANLCFCDFLLSSYGQTCIQVSCTTSPKKFKAGLEFKAGPGTCASDWRHDLITSTFDVTTHVIEFHPCIKFKVRRSPFGRYGAFSVSAIIGPETSTFDLSNSKWGHGSSVSWAFFLPIFSLQHPSILNLGSGTGQTNREGQADNGHQCFMAPPNGVGT